ncbi:GSCFA domain-containing protein [Chitinophaga sedimenti]|nr:GSCFA domain-containing protein [Chitinophaga sedimenti]MCK7556382.1 GSCFA domain-containing protein [Chitinophaga sedimenti]
MHFHLQFPVPPLPQPIQYQHSILMAGSCFAAEIGGLMQSHRFNVLLNPNGILFNPISIVQSIYHYLDGRVYTEADLFEQNGAWHSYQHHSCFSGTDKTVVLEKINALQTAATQRLKEADWLIITLGSAFGYILKKTGNWLTIAIKYRNSSLPKNCITPKRSLQRSTT